MEGHLVTEVCLFCLPGERRVFIEALGEVRPEIR